MSRAAVKGAGAGAVEGDGGGGEQEPRSHAHAAEDTPAWGFASNREHRWPASLATIVAIVLYVTLPDRLIPGPRLLLPAMEGVLLIPLSLAAPMRHQAEATTVRYAAIALIGLINLANLLTLGLLVRALLSGGQVSDGRTLVVSSLQIYVTNIIVFALWYWELDRGGPAARTRHRHRNPDFLFPQMTTPAAAAHRWVPSFLDYLYVSVTNATAFSPTDTMPLTPTAKALMMVQSGASLITVALVAARAVNILN